MSGCGEFSQLTLVVSTYRALGLWVFSCYMGWFSEEGVRRLGFICECEDVGECEEDDSEEHMGGLAECEEGGEIVFLCPRENPLQRASEIQHNPRVSWTL